MYNQNLVSKILEKFVQNGCRLWNIDTNIYKTWERFTENLKINEFDLKNFDCTEAYIKKLENNKLTFVINGRQVEPNSKRSNVGWSIGAMRQFISVGKAFGFFVIDEKNVAKTAAHVDIICKLTSDFSNLLKDDFMNNFHFYVLRIIQKGIIVSNGTTGHLGFLLFCCLLLQNNFVYGNYTFCCERVKAKKDQKKVLTFGGEEYNELIKEIERGTYGTAVKTLSQFNFDDIINSLIKVEEEQEIDFILTSEEKNDLSFSKNFKIFESFIDSSRCQLRENIISTRLKKENQFRYNDLINTIPEKWYVKDCEAAHIYNIWDIKKDVKNMMEANVDYDEIKSFIKKVTSDPNNGLLLLPSWHDYFDKGLFFFNANGEIIINTNDDELDRLDPISYKHDLSLVRIKPSVFNNDMKEYLILRNKK